MNAMPFLMRDEPQLPLNQPPIFYAASPPPKLHVGVFGSFLGGLSVHATLNEASRRFWSSLGWDAKR
jgi:hypothetical protein